jgi:hypothetical protein
LQKEQIWANRHDPSRKLMRQIFGAIAEYESGIAAPIPVARPVLTNAYVFSWRLAERNGILALTASVVPT